MPARGFHDIAALGKPAGWAVLLLIAFVCPSSFADSGDVVVATYEGVINPVAAEYLHDAILEADALHAAALIVKLDTPGGLDTSMRVIIKDMTSATVPVIVFVSPSGGRAASAGVFLTMAAHIAAMAPGTNIGAAHPVAMGGGEMDSAMKDKVENDAAAYLRSIAEQRKRNASWAEEAVRKSASATEQEAVKLRIIDFVAEDIPTLLKRVHGRQIILPTGPATLATEHATVREFPMGFRLEVLKALSDPNIAYLLMTVGTIGILAELYTPGAILPGIVGAISLILAFYSLQSLPINYAGVLLIIVGVIFLILEVSVTSYGLLTLGGLTAMVLGGLMLVKTDAPFLQVSLSFLLPTVFMLGTAALLLAWRSFRIARHQPITGQEAMIGSVGIAKTDLMPRGQIWLQGELWEAVSQTPIRQGEEAEIIAVRGLTLSVTPRHK